MDPQHESKNGRTNPLVNWYVFGWLAILSTVFITFGIRDRIRHQRDMADRDLTESRLKPYVDQFVTMVDENDRLIRQSQPDVVDAWGRFCRLEYHESQRTESVAFHSAGKDGAFGTSDDVRVFRTNVHWAEVGSDVGEWLGKSAVKAVNDDTIDFTPVVEGAARGVTKEVGKMLKEKFTPKPKE